MALQFISRKWLTVVSLMLARWRTVA